MIDYNTAPSIFVYAIDSYVERMMDLPHCTGHRTGADRVPRAGGARAAPRLSVAAWRWLILAGWLAKIAGAFEPGSHLVDP
jgi:hypothetical protein